MDFGSDGLPDEPVSALVVLFQAVERASDPESAGSLEHVRVDHRGRHVAMPEKLLHRPNVVAVFQKMSGEGVTQAVTRRALR